MEFYSLYKMFCLSPSSPHVHTELLTTPSNRNIFVSLFNYVISILKVSLHTYILQMMFALVNFES